MSALSKLLRLPAPERRLVLQAGALLVAVQLALVCTSPLQVRRLLGRLRGRPPHHSVPAELVVWAVQAVARHFPRAGDTCLTRALAAELLLLHYGHTAALRIGVARVGVHQFAAHAWVESDGHIVLGAAERPAYTELAGLEGGAG